MWLDELLPLDELWLELDDELLNDDSPLGADGSELESLSLVAESLADELVADEWLSEEELGSSLDSKVLDSLRLDPNELPDEGTLESLDEELLPLELDCESEEVESELATELPERLDEPDEPDSDDELLCDEPELEYESLLEELLGSELEDDELDEEELLDDELDEELEEEELEDEELDDELELELSLDELNDEALSDDSELSLLDGAEEPLDDVDDELLEDEPEDELVEELLSHGSQHSSRSHRPRSIRVALWTVTSRAMSRVPSRQAISVNWAVLSLLLLLDESQQIGTEQGGPTSTLRSWPQTKVQRCVGNVMVSPFRDGQGTNTLSTVVRPFPGGHEPLLDGSLDDGSLLDEKLLDDSLLDGSLVDEDGLDEDSLELLLDDELLSLEELLLDEDELDELDDELLEELDDDELEEEELDDDELGSQQPSPSTSTSHLQLSAKCFATPYVPAGTASVGLQSQPSPLDCDGSRQRSGQTTPIAS